MTAARRTGRALVIAGCSLGVGALSAMLFVALSRGAHPGFVLPLGALTLGLAIAVVAGLALDRRAR
ncbi:hypothetical protein L3Q67_41505 [Saccharothrix sp. AJ9571]|nr:hypothetical protein L3Q67_41505 [Saccharothrix sp. AJ9571]